MAHGLSISFTETTPGCTFNVYRNTTNQFPGGTPLASGFNTSPYLDTTGVAGQQYYYWMTAVLGGVETSPSNIGSGTFPTVPETPAITGVVAV